MDGGEDVDTYVKVIRSGARDGNGNLPPEVWRAESVAPTLSQFDTGSGDRATVLARAYARVADADDRLLPQGLDSHRYRCCGNGVVTPVAEWIGLRLAALFDQGSDN